MKVLSFGLNVVNEFVVGKGLLELNGKISVTVVISEEETDWDVNDVLLDVLSPVHEVGPVGVSNNLKLVKFYLETNFLCQSLVNLK